jgi:type I restriction enzyme S subunit
VKDLPPGWAWAGVNEIAETSSGGTPSRSEIAFFGGDIPWVKSGELKEGPVTGETEEHLTQAGLDNCNAKLLKPGTILVAMYGATTGRLGLLTAAATTNQAICAIEAHDGVEPRFLFYALLHQRSHLLSSRIGGAQPNISQGFLAKLKVPVPPSAEQRRIVAEIEKHFSRLEAAIASLRHAKANLKRCRRSATEAAFAAYSAAPIRQLGDLGETVGGVTKGQKRKAGIQTRPVPYLRVANVQRGNLDLDHIKCIEATEEEIRSLRLIYGDVLLNEGGDRDKLGRGWIWEGQIAECIHQNHVFRVRLNPLLAAPKFVSHYANHFGQRYFFEEGNQTTNLASLNMTKLRALPIPLPPVGEQDKLVTGLENHLSLIDDLDHSVDVDLLRAARLRQSILKKAFEGKLVPQDPNDEPASVLLDHVRSIRTETSARRLHKRG